MDMIRHQTVCPYLNAAPGAPLGHEIHVCLIICITEKGLLAAVAALGYVMGDAGGYNSCDACHAGIIADMIILSIEYTVPITQAFSASSAAVVPFFIKLMVQLLEEFCQALATQIRMGLTGQYMQPDASDKPLAGQASCPPSRHTG